MAIPSTQTSNNFDIFKSYGKKIKSLDRKRILGKDNWIRINKKEDDFYSLLTKPYGKYVVFTILCAGSLLFDFIINKIVLIWLADLTGVKVILWAFIFMILDASIALLASGLHAASDVEKFKLKKTWRPVLWSLGIIKIVLFIVTVFFISPDTYQHTPIMSILQLGFVIIIYTILDYAGSGLGYAGGYIKLKIIEFWTDDPTDMEIKIRNTFSDITQLCKKFNINFDDVLNHFGLEETFKINHGISK